MTYSIQPLALHMHHIPEMSAAFHREWSHLVPGKPVEWVEESFRSRTHLDRLPMAFVAVNILGEWLGAVSIKSEDMELPDPLSPWLSSLFVREPFRNQGVGQALVQKVLEACQDLGFPAVYLYTDSKEQFYLKRGWTLVTRQILHSSEITILRFQLDAC